MKKVIFDGKQTIKAGDETVTFIGGKAKVGEKVGFFSKLGSFVGSKPVANGVIVSACKDEKGAPISPTKTGKRKSNFWKKLYRIKITEIKE